MDFPSGELLKRFKSKGIDLESLLLELSKEKFTGVLKYFDDEKGNVLMIEGEVVALSFGENVGEKAIDSLLKAVLKGGTLEIYSLDLEKANFALKWYRDVHGFSEIKWVLDASREDILKRVGIPEPDKKMLEKVLEREGISHLLKKKEKR
ncbi:MAG: hypothetical protein ACE5K0_04320 [Candidatus Methanofastidiosia archaeon]